jgi:hypothetical protein
MLGCSVFFSPSRAHKKTHSAAGGLETVGQVTVGFRPPTRMRMGLILDLTAVSNRHLYDSTHNCVGQILQSAEFELLRFQPDDESGFAGLSTGTPKTLYQNSGIQ